MLGTEVETLLKKEGMDYIATDQEIDITNVEELQKFAQSKPITWIINCAAYTAVDKAEDEPDLAFKLNALGPLNIAIIAKDKKAKLIHISTDYVFDGTKEGAYVETDQPNPIGVYGASKYQGETNIQRIMNEYYILRTAWLYGKHGNNFVYTMLRLFQERDEVSIVGDQWGSPTYAPDLASVILEIMKLNSTAYGIYHFANEGRISWYDFAFTIHNKAKVDRFITREINLRKIVSDDYPTKAHRPRNSCMSKDKIKQNIGIVVRNWDVALKEFMGSEK